VALILDASVTLAWCFADEATDFTRDIARRVVAERAAAPAHWSYEIANVVWLGERRGRITVAQGVTFVQLLRRLRIDVVVEADTLAHAATLVGLARTHDLSVYDVAYIELAMRTGFPLATIDVRQQRVATALGVELVV
jgi:predicted nucleic acid-binding protein